MSGGWRFGAAFALAFTGAAIAAPPAAAFCGFYVSGADASLFNEATQVVLMRDGTRTVLSMQNDYTGPPEDFALVSAAPRISPQAIVTPRAAEDLNLERVERRLVEEALKKHGYNISLAAAELGLSRAALYRRMEKHGL